MENGVDEMGMPRGDDEMGRGLEDVIGRHEELEIGMRGEDRMGQEDMEGVHRGAEEDAMLMRARGEIGADRDMLAGAESGEHATLDEEEHLGLDEGRSPEGAVGGDEDDREEKNYKEGPWDVFELLVLVSAMKEDAETLGHPHEHLRDERERWHGIESFCWGQLVQRSAESCHEKWMSLSAEFKKVKDYECSILQGQKSYWEMTFDERKGLQRPPDFSQEVYNALWEWDDRDRIGEIGTTLVLEDEPHVHDSKVQTPISMGTSSSGSVLRLRKRTIDCSETHGSRKVSREESAIGPTSHDSQLLTQVGESGEETGELAETPPETQQSEDDAVWNLQLAQLRANQHFWAPHGRASATWAFYVVNDNSEPDSARPQQMRCAICHPAQQEHRPNSATRVRKGVVTYNKQHGTTSMKKHVAQEHGDIFTRYKATRKPGVLARVEGQHPRRSRKDPSPSFISDLFITQSSSKKTDPAQDSFLEDLVLYIAKGCHPVSMVENVWFRRLVVRQCGRVSFPAGRQLADEVIPRMVSQTMEKCILPSLSGCVTASVSFDYCMSRRSLNTFALVIHFINESWATCRVTVGVFDAPDTAGAALAMEVKDLLSSFNLTDKIIAYIMDDGSRLGSLTSALSSMVSCAPLQLPEPYAGTCFGKVMSNACEYATSDEKVCSDMKEVSVEAAVATVKRSITWTNRSEKRRHDWTKACGDVGLQPRKLRTPVKGRFASKLILFHEALDYQDAFTLCYPPQSNDIHPSPQDWAVGKTVIDTLTPVLHQCILNQSRGYWLLSDALATALGLCIQMHKEGIERGLASSGPKLDTGNFETELEVLQGRMMSEVMAALAPFLSFTVSYSAKHAHNMLALMLDPRYKGLSLVKDYVGRERALQVVTETDSNALLPCLVTVFKKLNPSSVENTPALSPTSKDSFDENSLFGSTASNDEAIIGLLKAEISLFRRLHIDPKDCGNPLAWWKDHEVQFPNVGFLARQVLGIVGSQVETERIFSLVGVIATIRRRQLGVDNLNKLVLIRENWPEGPRAGRKVVESGVKGFLSAERDILEDNEDLIMQAGLFDDE